MTLPISEKKAHWEPVVWTPFYETIVLESLLDNTSNVVLAQKYGYTPQQISNILNTQEARDIRVRLINEIRAGTTDVIEKRRMMREKAIDRIADMLDNDELFSGKTHLAATDRAFRFLEGAGDLKAKGDNNTNVQVNVVTPEVMGRFTEALEASNKAKQLHGIEVKDVSRESEDHRSSPRES